MLRAQRQGDKLKPESRAKKGVDPELGLLQGQNPQAPPNRLSPGAAPGLPESEGMRREANLVHRDKATL